MDTADTIFSLTMACPYDPITFINKDSAYTYAFNFHSIGISGTVSLSGFGDVTRWLLSSCCGVVRVRAPAQRSRTLG